MIRFVRQGTVRATRERWLLRGIVRIVTHPLPQPGQAARAAGGREALDRAAERHRPPASGATQ